MQAPDWGWLVLGPQRSFAQDEFPSPEANVHMPEGYVDKSHKMQARGLWRMEMMANGHVSALPQSLEGDDETAWHRSWDMV